MNRRASPCAILTVFCLFANAALLQAQEPAFAAGNWDDDTIVLLGADMASVDSFAAGAEDPNGVAFDGTLIYSAHFTNDTVYAYDLDGNIQFSWTRGELGSVQAMTFSGGALVFGGALDDIFFVDPADGSDIRDIPLPDQCSGLEGMQAVGGNLWLLCDEGLILIDATSGSFIGSQSSPTSGCSFSGTALAAADTTTLVLGCGSGDWYFYDIVSESVVDSGNNGIAMFGLTALLFEDLPPPSVLEIPTLGDVGAILLALLLAAAAGMVLRKR
ncbi:MAG TPA: hypothetical protein VMT16_12920 [Thermoanaerobaculia bacterium]|nr:hypothetical protein [Thermoanaerobaculia bacterium]